MKDRILYGILITVLGLNLLAGFQVYVDTAKAGTEDDPYANFALLAKVIEMIREDYVDSDKISYQELIHAALRGMVSTLDPHSEFMPPRRFTDLKSDTEGQFGGLGIVVSSKNGILTVVSPMEDTPGYRAGIQRGDRIIKIDGRPTENLTLTDAVSRLRGKPGTEVSISVLRDGEADLIDITIKRAVIKIATVKDGEGHAVDHRDSFELGKDKIGYVRVLQFGERTSNDLSKALERLAKQGMESLVLDLRGNPGGLLDQAVEVCDLFLPRDQPILTTEGRKASQRSSHYSDSLSDYSHLKVAVLVNGGSASASEIVAGCLQDSTTSGACDAVIIGEQTFGKGSVQSILPLENGAALRLTTARYYTPSHKVIHERGITPDIVVPMNRDQEEALFYRRAPGGFDTLDDKEMRERLSKASDVQLDRAIEVLKGISVIKNETGEEEQEDSRKVAAKK